MLRSRPPEELPPQMTGVPKAYSAGRRREVDRRPIPLGRASPAGEPFQPCYRPPMDAESRSLSTSAGFRQTAIRKSGKPPARDGSSPCYKWPVTNYGARCAALLHLQDKTWRGGIGGAVKATC